MRLPLGFEIAGVTAGLKASGKPDLGLVYSPYPLAWALTSTDNLVKAPCVSRNRSRYTSRAAVRGIVVNSGNANCATGERGIWDNEDMAGAVAAALALARVQDMLTASTGVIGEPLPVDRIRQAVPALTGALGDDSGAFADAILTTDTAPKQVAATVDGGGRILGIAKGSGMIHPNMATMLAFILTDVDVSQDALRAMWPGIVERTFNQITVDGDTSTNDMAIVLSSRQLAADVHAFADALEEVAGKLARKIARDGEGAEHLLSVRVTGARTGPEARDAARTVAGSALVKTAVHGADPNWGRILAAIGRSSAISDLANLRIALQGVTVYQGVARPFDRQALSERLRAEEILIEVDLAAGESVGEAWGCDLSPAYVRINADYTT
ncbi:MAG TPA: bifunctional glutamate N-acetyltransferase/amino-acid acetyltransferase ArgJ [Trueperaceae bacterium]|nr:bifunctional glutamate N-acetyltransferase/amino-acid acetyltransferase ArgJ [Trueperaceae bacterium]